MIPHEDAKGRTVPLYDVTDYVNAHLSENRDTYHFPTDYAYENWPSDDEDREWRLTGLAIAVLMGALVGFAVGMLL